MRSRHVAAIAAAFVLCSSPLGAQDARSKWNEFRGPNGSGIADQCRPPVVIDVEKPAWKIDVPPGYSSPVLSAKLIFLTAVEGDRLATLAFDRQTGKRVWHALAPKVPIERVHETSSPAASTPCADGDRVYVYFGSYGLLCYDVRGHLVWKKPIPTPKSSYGMATSPIVNGNLLILVLDNDANLPGSQLSQSKIIALDKSTGTPVWETPRPFHRSGWSTPTIWTHAGGRELVVLGNRCLRGYEITSGVEKWSVSGFSRETIARPIATEDFVFASSAMLGGVSDDSPDPEPFWRAVMRFDANGDHKLERKEMTWYFSFPLRPELPIEHSGFGLPLPNEAARRRQRQEGMFAGVDKNKDGFWTKDEFLDHLSFRRAKPNLVAVRPGGHGDVTDTHVAWALHRGIPEVPSPIIHHARIYLICDGGILSAVDAHNGKVIYRKRLRAAGHYRAAPVVADDRLYLISERGVVSVVRAGDTFALLHQQSLGEQVAATPAVDESTIYIRTAKHLLAFRRQTRE